jgi:hypothetical protein
MTLIHHVRSIVGLSLLCYRTERRMVAEGSVVQALLKSALTRILHLPVVREICTQGSAWSGSS